MKSLQLAIFILVGLLLSSCSAVDSMPGTYKGTIEVINLSRGTTTNALIEMSIEKTADATYSGFTEVPTGELIDTKCLGSETNLNYLKCIIDLGVSSLELIGQVEGSEYIGSVSGVGTVKDYTQGSFSLTK